MSRTVSEDNFSQNLDFRFSISKSANLDSFISNSLTMCKSANLDPFISDSLFAREHITSSGEEEETALRGESC